MAPADTTYEIRIITKAHGTVSLVYRGTSTTRVMDTRPEGAACGGYIAVAQALSIDARQKQKTHNPKV